MSHYDVIVIGSGAGGGTLAHRLATTGRQILLLERGDWLPREPENWSAHDVFVENRYVSPDTWYDGDRIGERLGATVRRAAIA
jgi:choline dehydrogenase-like flavoprotein